MMTLEGSRALELRSVCQSYTQAPPWVLKDLDAAISAGSMAAILGPNGAGKTTLLYIILGYLPPQSGEVLIMGERLGSLTRSVRSRWISFVPQQETLPFPLTAYEYALMGRAPFLGLLSRPGPQDHTAVEAAMIQLGLEALWDRPIAALSGGEAQLLRLARAVVQETRLLLLDEPTAHLDLKNRAVVLDALRRIAGENGRTVVFTTHEPEAALWVADEAILMRDGQVLASGLARNVLTSENLSRLYDLPLTVQRVDGHSVVLPGGSQGHG